MKTAKDVIVKVSNNFLQEKKARKVLERERLFP